MSFRDEVLGRLDVRAFMEAQGVEIGARAGGDEWRFRCPFHDDREPSANINLGARAGLWHCKACNVGGGPIDFVLRKEGLPPTAIREALDRLAEFAGVTREPAAPTNRPSAPRPRQSRMTDESVAGWHAAALRNAELMRWFADKRGFSDETVALWQLGWDGQRVTIPIRDAAGKLVNVRRYLRNAPSEAQKMLNIMGSGEARIVPAGELPREVVLVEGEWDMILMRQQGFAETFTATGGAGTFKPEWVDGFRDRAVTILYDNDDAGRRGAAKVARMLAPVAAAVRVCLVPNLPEHGDPTDFFVEQQRSIDELRGLIADATPFLVAATTVAEPTTARRVTLAEASDARYQGERLELPVLLSGKAMTPYTVPFEFNVHCSMANKRFCGICPLAEASGSRDVTLTAREPAVLSLVNVTDEGRYKALKALAGAVPQCNLPQVDVKAFINVEELRIIPELDSGGGGGDTEYVARQGYFLGHGLRSNLGYSMRGYSHPHPKSQATVHLLSEAIAAQDNIGSFALTPELKAGLQQFHAPQGEGAVAAKFRDVYDDFAGTVHRIRDRFDMQVAYDLVWHSVIAFHFNGAYVRRGWVEGMVISDSGQGKSEMAQTLLRHYRLGERVQSEQASMAGLLGGLEKMGDTWILSWGRIPLNDRRLLVVDETQGLAPQAIEALSDVRASGVAEITKIRTERTNARCRILWLANPVSGLTLAQHNQGVLAIKELFKKPEDIRRLDFALALASGDVDFARSINVHHGAATEPRYSSELSRALVLWAWSRRPEQVQFTTEATDETLAAATELGRRYHSSIPLVEPSDQRLKIARLAAAAAARVYSTDETGERLIVEAGHVRFIVDYLDRIYNSRAMAYGEYSGQQRRGESLGDDEARSARTTMEAWEHDQEAIAFFRAATVFRKQELEDVVGWDADYVKAQLRWLTNARLIRGTRNGYVKTPAFIALLRGMDVSTTVLADVAAALEEAAF